MEVIFKTIFGVIFLYLNALIVKPVFQLNSLVQLFAYIRHISNKKWIYF